MKIDGYSPNAEPNKPQYLIEFEYNGSQEYIILAAEDSDDACSKFAALKRGCIVGTAQIEEPEDDNYQGIDDWIIVFIMQIGAVFIGLKYLSDLLFGFKRNDD